MLYFITGNQHKIEVARQELQNFYIQFQPKSLDIIEIQSDSIEEIAINKAKKAFEIIQQPLIVKDDGWFISSLHGFPGAFMHYINEWFSADDLLRLMKDKSDRVTNLHEVLCYIDNTQTKVFSGDIKGRILTEARGNDLPNNCITTMRSNGKTIAECRAMNELFYDQDASQVWRKFAEWYNTYSMSSTEK